MCMARQLFVKFNFRVVNGFFETELRERKNLRRLREDRQTYDGQTSICLPRSVQPRNVTVGYYY